MLEVRLLGQSAGNSNLVAVAKLLPSEVVPLSPPASHGSRVPVSPRLSHEHSVVSPLFFVLPI